MVEDIEKKKKKKKKKNKIETIDEKEMILTSTGTKEQNQIK